MPRGHRTVSKVDGNHYEVIKRYENLGAYVLDIHTVSDASDIIVIYRGVISFVEIKDPVNAEFPKYFKGLSFEEKEKYIIEKHLTKGERKCMENVRARNGNYHIVWDRESVLKSLGLS